MAVAIEDVPMWVEIRGIGHAVRSGTHPAFTACNALVYGCETSVTPYRICSKCRKRLKDATLTAPQVKEIEE